jgi:hypothetical protein
MSTLCTLTTQSTFGVGCLASLARCKRCSPVRVFAGRGAPAAPPAAPLLGAVRADFRRASLVLALLPQHGAAALPVVAGLQHAPRARRHPQGAVVGARSLVHQARPLRPLPGPGGGGRTPGRAAHAARHQTRLGAHPQGRHVGLSAVPWKT